MRINCIINYLKCINVLLCICLLSCKRNRISKLTVNSEYSIDVEQEFYADSIIMKLKQDLKNESICKYFSHEIDTIVYSLNKSKFNSNVLWPYTKIDSLKYVLFKSREPEFIMCLPKKREILKVIKLHETKVKAILNIFNNPNYFGYGECGTQFTESELLFYSNDTIKGRIVFSCNEGQANCTPHNIFYKFGAFNEKGYQIKNSIRYWE